MINDKIDDPSDLTLLNNRLSTMANANLKLKEELRVNRNSGIKREEKIKQLRREVKHLEKKNKDNASNAKDDFEKKVNKLQEKNKTLQKEITRQGKFIKDVGVSISKSNKELTRMSRIINEIFRFLGDHSFLIKNVISELKMDRKSLSLSKKLTEFKKLYDKILIDLKGNKPATLIKQYDPPKTSFKTARQQSTNRFNSRVSIKKTKKRSSSKKMSNSIISKNSSHRSILLNISQTSKKSIKSRRSSLGNSSAYSRKSIKRKRSKKNNLSFINSKIDKHERSLKRIKKNYKDLTNKNEMNEGDDPLIKEKMNYFANEIQKRSKKLITLRKNQREVFKGLFNNQNEF